MKVVAINGSPHGGKGNTALVLDPFLEGMKAMPAQEVKVFETKAMTVRAVPGRVRLLVPHAGTVLPGGRHADAPAGVADGRTCWCWPRRYTWTA